MFLDEPTHTKMISLAEQFIELGRKEQAEATCATGEERLFVAETHIGLRMQTDYYSSWETNHRRSKQPSILAIPTPAACDAFCKHAIAHCMAFACQSIVGLRTKVEPDGASN
jgi:hypothetical protein